jgi:phage tail sheath protein FI
MISLLSNQDDYKFNVLITPGLFANGASVGAAQVNTIINNTMNRGDNIYVADLVTYSGSVNDVITQANAKNTSYAASYWPWVQTVDPSTSQLVWVPASTLVAGVYAYNDNVSEPWFAPAGINRGGLSTVVRAEKKLTQTNRDTLYTNKVNPIATFPGTGVVVYGQKTLQTKASALDRVNVRRLLISLKSYIGQVANNLVFEQNTISTRNSFLAQVNPYLESVQQRQGLYAFKVVMDSSNNTPDVIDRNQLVGQIYLQPTKTAEFVYLNFNILPTGVSFPA